MSRSRVYVLAALLATCVGWITSRLTPAYVLRITMTASVEGVAQCFFDSGAGLSEQNSVRRPVRASKLVHLTFPLARGTYTGIRFDPLDREADVRIIGVEVQDVLRRTIARVNPNALRSLNDIDLISREPDGPITFHCRGTDPQLGLRFDPPLPSASRAAARLATAGAMLLAFASIVTAWELSRVLRLCGAGAALLRSITSFVARGAAAWPVVAVGIVVAALGVELTLFLGFAAPRHAAVYPRWNDQIQYLSEAYTAHELSTHIGFWRALFASVINPSAQGTLHDVYTTIVFAMTGPSRVAALSLNVLALVGWQITNLIAARRGCRSWSVAVIAALLPALGVWQWQDLPGSAFDFRLDHLAMCLLGITGAIALIAAETATRRWSACAGVAAGTLIDARFLTVTYVLGAFAIGFLLAAALRRKAAMLRLTIAAAACAVVSGPILFLDRHLIYNYYVIGHYFGEESRIRNQHYGIIKSIGYVLHGALLEHAGALLLGIIAVGLAAAVVHVARMRRVDPAQSKATWWVGAVFTVVPLAILTLHAQKSPIVLGAIVPGAIWLGVAGLASARRLFAGFGALFAAGTAVLTLADVTARLSHAAPSPEASVISREAYGLAQLIYRDSHAHGENRPSIATDHITDCVDAQVFRVLTYEAHRTWIDYEMSLSGIGTPREADVRAAFEHSDYLIVTRAGGTEAWPFDTALKAMRPSLLDWCARNADELATLDLAGREVVVFRRRHPVGPAAAERRGGALP